MTPEGKIEAYLHKRVNETGGEWRRLQWIGRNGAPDDIVWWPDGIIVFVEVKAPGEKPRKIQLYEHRKMRETGLQVYVIDTEEAVDSMIAKLRS